MITSIALSRHLSRPFRICFGAYAVIIACWIPIFFAGYPGFFSYDAGIGWLMQWSQIESNTLNAHHPIIHTLFLEYTIKIGRALFGSFNAGIAFSVSIQAIVVAFLLVFSLFLCLKQGLGKLGFCLSVGFYALNPIIGMFAFCTTKDVFFSALLVAYCVGLAYRFGVTSNAVNKQNNLLWGLFFVVTLFLIGVLRSNALVAIILFIPILALLVSRKNRKVILGTGIISFLLCLLVLGPISSLLHVQKSPIGAWNALCVAEQQIARCAFSTDVSVADKDYINELLPNLKYKENLSDVARSAFMSSNASKEELLVLYFKLGIDYPGEYIKAFLFQTEDAWSPFSVIDCYQTGDVYQSSVFEFVTKEPGMQNSKFPQLASFLEWVSADPSFQHSPLGIVASIPLCVFAMLFLLFRSMALRQIPSILFVLPLFVMTLSNLFGPCVLIRYYLYLFYAFPVMLFMLPGIKKNEPKHLKLLYAVIFGSFKLVI